MAWNWKFHYWIVMGMHWKFQSELNRTFLSGRILGSIKSAWFVSFMPPFISQDFTVSWSRQSSYSNFPMIMKIFIQITTCLEIIFLLYDAIFFYVLTNRLMKNWNFFFFLNLWMPIEISNIYIVCIYCRRLFLLTTEKFFTHMKITTLLKKL